MINQFIKWDSSIPGLIMNIAQYSRKCLTAYVVKKFEEKHLNILFDKYVNMIVKPIQRYFFCSCIWITLRLKFELNEAKSLKFIRQPDNQPARKIQKRILFN